MQEKNHRCLYNQKHILVPRITVGADNSLVNFISLAESVALEPIDGFCTSLDVCSKFDVDDFDWLADELAFRLLLFCSSS